MVHTEHDREPVTEGKAYLYFWPGGGTERAVVQVGRAGDEEGLSVVVSALTGRARIQRGNLELEPARADGEFDVREDDE
jgi:general secretion pathway protein H